MNENPLVLNANKVDLNFQVSIFKFWLLIVLTFAFGWLCGSHLLEDFIYSVFEVYPTV